MQPPSTNVTLERTGSVLIIEDDLVTRHYLARTLEGYGCTVIEAASGEDGLLQASLRQPEVVLLDLGLPDMEGVEVISRLREWTNIPILILSLRGQDEDKVNALDAGADDYLTKPCSVPEMLARLRVAFRRSASAEKKTNAVVCVDQLVIDLLKRNVTVNGQDVKLTPIEYNMLAILAKQKGQVVTQRQLLQEVWGPQYVKETNYLRLYIKQLRDKLEPNPSLPRYILTAPGVGYRLAEE